jgi:hypothetical protein
MIFEQVNKSGDGIEIVVNGRSYWFDCSATKDQIINAIESRPVFDQKKYEQLKSLEGRDI